MRCITKEVIIHREVEHRIKGAQPLQHTSVCLHDHHDVEVGEEICLPPRKGTHQTHLLYLLNTRKYLNRFFKRLL